VNAYHVQKIVFWFSASKFHNKFAYDGSSNGVMLGH